MLDQKAVPPENAKSQQPPYMYTVIINNLAPTYALNGTYRFEG